MPKGYEKLANLAWKTLTVSLFGIFAVGAVAVGMGTVEMSKLAIKMRSDKKALEEAQARNANVQNNNKL